jgi:hypothetical protein
MLPCVSSISIKSNAARLVKPLGLWLSVMMAMAAPGQALAQEPGALPKITARTYSALIIRRSRSQRMYLIGGLGTELPQPGKIVLLKRGEENSMALRVLKQYPETREIAAKNVRAYGEVQVLEPGENLVAVEKLGDLANIPPPVPTAQDQADLAELESPAVPPPPATEGAPPEPMPEVDAPAPEPAPKAEEASDSAPSPVPPPPTRQGLSEEEEDDIDRQLEGLEVEETDDFTPWYQWFTLGAGLLSNNDFESGVTRFVGGGARYQLDIGHRLIMDSGTAQDSLSLEGSLFYYSIVGYAEITEEGGLDSYTVMPMMGSLKYTIWLGEEFGFFGYVGLVKSMVTVIEPPVAIIDEEDAVALLSSSFVSAGGGAMFRIGPNWYGRLDAGSDFIGAGIVLSF